MGPYVRIIRGLREEHKLNQADVGKVLGVSQQYYSKYENGEYEMPVRHLLTLASYYHVTLDYITGRTKSRHGLDIMNQKLASRYTVGEIFSKLIELNEAQRAAVADFILFLAEKKRGNSR